MELFLDHPLVIPVLAVNQRLVIQTNAVDKTFVHHPGLIRSLSLFGTVAH